MKELKAVKRSSPEIENTGKKFKSDGGKKNMSLAKSFASALTTKAQMSDAEVADIINSFMKEIFMTTTIMTRQKIRSVTHR